MKKYSSSNLSKKQISIVVEICRQHLNLKQTPVYMFGSRASGNYRPNSDLDLMIDDSSFSVPPEVITYLNEAFEESDLLFSVDITLKSRLEKNFFESISDSMQLLV